MEHKLLVKDVDNELIIRFSNALKQQGIYEGADYYYIDENINLPFFKIPKPYKKEQPTDPDVHYIFVDIDKNPPFLEKEEYTVYGNYVHEHIPNADSAAELVKLLYTGEYVEVAIVYPDRRAGFFLKNQGEPEKNVNILMENAGIIVDCLSNAKAGGHMHRIFSPAHPYNLQFGIGEQHKLQGYEIYAVSSVLAEHPEFYILK